MSAQVEKNKVKPRANHKNGTQPPNNKRITTKDNKLIPENKNNSFDNLLILYLHLALSTTRSDKKPNKKIKLAK